MRKSRADAEDDFGDLHFLGDDIEQFDVGHVPGQSGPDDEERRRPARQRLELRNEQRTLRQQLSDWDDYSEDFDTDLR